MLVDEKGITCLLPKSQRIRLNKVKEKLAAKKKMCRENSFVSVLSIVISFFLPVNFPAIPWILNNKATPGGSFTYQLSYGYFIKAW